MKHKSDPILEVHVELDPAGITELDSEIGHVTMIPFSGTVQGPLFSGIVEPCGVDTQVTNCSDVRHMSARYMLTGKDADGRDCHIYVENNGWFTGTPSLPFTTVPTFITDHKGLRELLSRPFIGKGFVEEDGLHIRFYEAGKD